MATAGAAPGGRAPPEPARRAPGYDPTIATGSFRFLFLADPQLGCYAHGVPEATGWEWDAARYRDAVVEGLAWEPDLVIVGGDMVDDLASAGQLADFARISEGFGAVEVRFVPGNHDLAHDALVPTPASVAAYRAAFGAEEAVFERGGASFVIANTVLLDQPGVLGADAAAAHLAFLDGALAEAAARPGPTVVCGHHPLFVDAPDEPDSYWNVATPARRAVLELLGRHGADLVLSGHLHRSAAARYEGVELVTAAAVGVPLGADPSGYLVVDVDEGRIEHRFVALADQGRD